LSSWARRGKGADAARHAVARVARRAGGGAARPGARAAVAGPRERRCTDRHALRARLGREAGEVDVGAQRNGCLRRAAADVDRAGRRRGEGVQRAGGEDRLVEVRDRQRRAEVAPGGGAIRERAVDRRGPRDCADVADRARAIVVAGTARCADEREQADRAIRRRSLADGGAAGTEVQAAAGEVPDDGVAGVQDVATGAAGNAGGELEERSAHRLKRRGRGRGRGAGGGRRRGAGGGRRRGRRRGGGRARRGRARRGGRGRTSRGRARRGGRGRTSRGRARRGRGRRRGGGGRRTCRRWRA